MTQAVLAEPGLHTKESTKVDGLGLPKEAAGTGTSAVVLTMKAVESQAQPQESSAVLPKASLGAPLPTTEPNSLSEALRATTQPSPSPVPFQSLSDALAGKSSLAAQAPTVHAADGSALAALNALAKPTEVAPAAVLAPPPASATPRLTPVMQVDGGLRWMLKGGVQEAQLQLHPDSLGQVTIHLRVEGGEVHARLWVTEPASVQAVQEGRPQLELSLKEQGLQLGSFDLQQGQRPFQEAPATPAYRESAVLEAVPARQEAPAGVPLSILNPRHVELYA